MTTETVQMPVMTVEKKPEKVKLTKEERAAKKAATAAKKAAAELEKKQKAEELSLIHISEPTRPY